MFAELWPVSWSNQERSYGVGTRLAGLDINMQVWVDARVVIFTRHSSSALACIQREGKGAGWHLTPSHRYLHVIITFLSTSPIVNTINATVFIILQLHSLSVLIYIRVRWLQVNMQTAILQGNLCNKSWNAGCDELSLSDHRLYLKFFSVSKIIHKLCYFPTS